MKKQKKKVRDVFATPFFNEIRKTVVPYGEAYFSKELKAKVVLEKFDEYKGLYFIIFRSPLPAPNDRFAFCLSDYINMKIPLKEKRKSSSPKLERQGTGDVFLKQMEALKFTNPKFNSKYWTYTREKVIPMIEESLSDQSNTKFRFYAIINENDIPIMLMENETTGELLTLKMRTPDENELISNKFSPHIPGLMN